MARDLHRLSMDELLDLRICDLNVRIEGTWLESAIDKVLGELDERGLALNPHFWFADEWFSPDHVPGVAIPFYLAHPRLIRLERRQMFEVEGGTRPECIRLLRHELGHAIDHAYQLHRRRSWQKIFGLHSEPYPDYYRPDPASRAFVQHLNGWYAQSHPAEDFAETFAVWLNPRSNWRVEYEGWRALQKLEYVDSLMRQIAGIKPKIRNRSRPYSLAKLRHTLRTHYDRKRAHYEVNDARSDLYDEHLLEIFSDSPRLRHREAAATFLRRHRREIRESVARWTGGYQFTLEHVLKELIGRCRDLNLRMSSSERSTKLNFSLMLAVHTVHYVYRGREWHAL